MQLAWAVWPVGCLLISTSLTVGESWVLRSVWSSRCRMPPSPLFERRSKAALHFPANIRSAKDRAIFSVDFGVEVLSILLWIAIPSSSRLFRSPSFQDLSLLSRQAA